MRELEALLDEVTAYPNVAALTDSHSAAWDVTLDELAVEFFFPADDESEAMLRG